MQSPARRIAIQAPLGFSSGIPLYLTGATLVAWLATENVDLKTIGAFALVSLPYNLKWLWAPLLDRYRLPFLGRRRGWMLLIQIVLFFAIATLGAIDVRHNTGTLALVAIGVAFMSATQDILVDAYRTDTLKEGERGKGTAAYVAGYRTAMIVAGYGALLLADHISWRAVYVIEASLLSIGIVATLCAPESKPLSRSQSLREAVISPLSEFFQRRSALLVLVFIMLYRAGDAVANHMVTPFLLRDQGFSLSDIALLQKFLGLGASVVGAAIGGLLVDRAGIRRSLLWFGAAQALANLGYVLLALTGKSYGGLVIAIGIDNLLNGFGFAAFVAYLMALCHARFSATQYALFTSASSILGRAFALGSGYVIAFAGWAVFFLATIAIAAPALVLWRWLPSVAEPERSSADENAFADTWNRPSIRMFAGAVTLGFVAAVIWRFALGDWKLGLQFAVGALFFGAFTLIAHSKRGPARSNRG